MLQGLTVFVLWLGEIDSLEALFPAWLLSCALIWPDLPLIKEQDFQLVYLKLLPFASWVVTGMAANYIHSVSPGWWAAIRGAPAQYW